MSSTRTPGKRHILPALVMGVIMLAGLFCYLKDNDYPFFYTPMEQTKTHQVINNNPNFKHPAFMLTMTRVVATLTGHGLNLERQHQPLVEIGRSLNAFYAVIALGCLMWLAYRYCGFWGVPVFGAAAVMSLNLLEQAHMMKEEVPFLMGVALVFLTTYLLYKNPTRRNLILTAVASAIVLSAKWPGVLMAGFAFAFLLFYRQELPRRIWKAGNLTIGPYVAFLLIFAGLFLVFNHQMLFHLKQFVTGVLYEAKHASLGRNGEPTANVYSYYLQYYWQDIPHLFKIFFLLYFVPYLVNLKKRTLHEWLEMGFFMALVLVLLVAKTVNHRYFLVVEILMLYLGTKGFFQLLPQGGSRHRDNRYSPHIRAAAGVMIVAISLMLQGPAFAKHVAMLSNDSRAALLKWVNTHLPADAVLAADSRTGLPTPDNKFTKIALEKGWVPPLKPRYIYSEDKSTVGKYVSVANLRDLGVTHVAILKDIYVEKDGSQPSSFYEELSAGGKLVWEWTPRDPDYDTFLDMPIQLFDIRSVKPAHAGE